MSNQSSIGTNRTGALGARGGQNTALFVDRLGARLVFERVGVRIYQAATSKIDAYGSWPGGPTREELDSMRLTALAHFRMLTSAIDALGADASALTPMADVELTATRGLLQVVTDPRTTLAQALHAVLFAELVDVDAWTMLVALADQMGQAKQAEDFRRAQHEEETHLARVRGWLSSAMQLEAQH
jgi:hypothetical protein